MQPIRVSVIALTFLAVAARPGAAQGRGRGRGEEPPPPSVAAEEQQRRIQEEQRRAADYQRHLDEQIRAQQQRHADLQTQRRAAQLRAQQEYAAQLARQQAQLRTQRDYAKDAYISTPHIYRYRVGDAYRETNQYGADLLRQAVNDGYQQGYRAGEADRLDHWKSDYARSPAYVEATYGYSGSYVDQTDYSFYFRERLFSASTTAGVS